nr:MFS transporter [Pseudoroseomonas coralli]
MGQVPAGWLVDRLRAKRSVLVGLVGWFLATFLMSGVGWLPFPFLELMVLRFLLGILEIPVGPASGRVIATWFPSTERGIAGSIFNSAQYVSLVIFTLLMGWLDHVFGWEHIFGIMGVLGLILGAVWAIQHFAPPEHPTVSPAEIDYIRAGGALVDLGSKPAAETPETARFPVSAPFRSHMLVGIFIAQYCITSITWVFVAWLPSYLVKGRGFDMLQAGFIAALPAIFGCIGGVTSGFISD